MTVSEFLTAVNYALRGTDDDAPTFGEDEANYWVATLNRKKNELYNNSNVLWDSTWSIESLGAVTADVSPEYECDDALIAASDEVYIVDSNSQKIYFDIIRPKERQTGKRQVYIAGMNPKVLYFTSAIDATEDLVGGTLYLPGYYMPADVALSTDALPLPDPYWGVMSVAAELAGNDIIYEDKEANLTAKANALYQQMIRNNRRGTYGTAKKSPHDHYRIKSPEVR